MYDTGGAAFPHVLSVDGDLHQGSGMTLQDYMATQFAAQQLLAALALKLAKKDVSEKDVKEMVELIPGSAYDLANSMIKEKRRRERQLDEEQSELTPQAE